MDRRDCVTKMTLRLGPALLVILSFTTIMAGVIFHAISINELNYGSPAISHFEPNVTIGDQDNNLVWFLQITDLHLSNRGHFDRVKDFSRFAKSYVDIIKPDVVLVTGDITDGRQPNTTFGTGPQLDEWLAYYETVTKSGALEKTKWLDIRGNHDNLNVFRPGDPNTLYRQYSIRGREHARNYRCILEKKGKNYTFIGVDEVQTPGLKIPFNFIGIVDGEDLTELRKFKDEAKSMRSEYTIWFAHYPTSSIVSPNEGLRNIIDGPYLCGHYHTIGGWVKQMHATQQPGFAEVELGDWKYERRIRLASIDNQLFNFVDIKYGEFPIALLTNPKRPEYNMPKYEPIERIARSTHLRVIAFSNSTIKRVELSIDAGQHYTMKRVSDDSPLYVLPWPNDYSTGYHKVEIYVEDSANLSRVYSQGFSLDGSKNDFTLGAKILLRAYFRTCVMTMFFSIVAICTLPLLVLRMIVHRHQGVGLKKHYRGTFLYDLHLLSNIKRLFIPLITVPIWMAIGPHFIGRMVDEAIGACFVWGVLIDGKFIYTGITFTVASIYLTFIHIPEIILLTYQVSNSYKSTRRSNAPARVLNFKFIFHIMLTVLQCWMGMLLYSAYGIISYLTSFPFAWCAIIYGYCWYQCGTLNESDFVKFNRDSLAREERRSLTGSKARDDKSSASDQSTC